VNLRAAGSAAGAGLLGLLCACASPGPARSYFLEDSYARYYAAGSGRTLRVERDGTVLDVTCLPVELAQDKPRDALPRALCANSEIPVLGRARKDGTDWELSGFDVERPTGRCRPLFRAPTLDERESGPLRSCWNRLWEVPTALVVYPVAVAVLIGVAAAPVWVPLIFLR